MTLRSITIATLLLACSVPAHGQDHGVAALVERAGRYVQEYEKQFSALVCEERQQQRIVRAGGRERKRRELVSDLLLVKVGDKTVSFRDVIAVDGKTVRDRQERLRKLFLDGTGSQSTMRQARAIADESTRYNIGFSRSLEALMVPLEILQPRSAAGFQFASATEGLTFQEFRSPSLVRYRNGGRVQDMFLRGRFTLDVDSGRVRGATLIATNSAFETTFDIRYLEDANLGLLVPAEMHEQYRHAEKPGDDQLEVRSSYSNFRRFQVRVDERFDAPK
jgi:hypothetical protein